MTIQTNKLCIGTAQFGMPYGIANNNGQVNLDNIVEILDLSWGNGIDTLDTAKSYGNSEEAIGNSLKNFPEKSWKIITKISNQKDSISAQINDSFEKLTIHPTVILAHSAELFLDKKFQMQLKNFINENFNYKIGVSLYTENEIERVLESGFGINIIQLPLNILDTRLYRCGILDKLNDQDIEIHARSVFLQGLFYLSDSDLKNRFNDSFLYIQKLKSIAAESGLTLAELSLLWLVKLENLKKVIIGVDNAMQLKIHLETLKKEVDSSIFEDALTIHCENESILNPSKW